MPPGDDFFDLLFEIDQTYFVLAFVKKLYLLFM